MIDEFKYDVFLSHASADKPAVRELAQRLKGDGLRVWFDECLKAGDHWPAMIEEGLEGSRAMVLVWSKAFAESEWCQYERLSYLFRDPNNQQRQFIPLRLDDCEMKWSLKQFVCVDWRRADANEYVKLLERCRWGKLVSVEPNSPKGGHVTCTGELHGFSTPWHVWLAVCLKELEHAYKIWPKVEVSQNATWSRMFRHYNKYYPKIVVELIAVQDDEHLQFEQATTTKPERRIIDPGASSTTAMARTSTMVVVDSLAIECNSPENA